MIYPIFFHFSSYNCKKTQAKPRKSEKNQDDRYMFMSTSTCVIDIRFLIPSGSLFCYNISNICLIFTYFYFFPFFHFACCIVFSAWLCILTIWFRCIFCSFGSVLICFTFGMNEFERPTYSNIWLLNAHISYALSNYANIFIRSLTAWAEQCWLLSVSVPAYMVCNVRKVKMFFLFFFLFRSLFECLLQF